MTSTRIYKINELIKSQISQIIFNQLNLEVGILTVTAVETTPDLHQTLVWLSYVGDDFEKVEKELSLNQKAIQRELNKRLTLRHVPKIFFRHDKSGDYVSKITKILNDVREENHK